MNEERFSQFLDEIGAERIPASVDLWPQIQARIDNNSSKGALRMRRTLVSLVGVVLLLIMGSILVFPPVRNAAAQAIREIESLVVGMAGGPRGPQSYSPPPPFTVKLPGYLPEGFRYVGGEFNPGGNLVSVGQEAVQLPGRVIEGTQTEPEIVDQSLIPKVERDRSLPFIVARYHDNEEFHVEIFERQALADEELPSGDERMITDQPARLQKSEHALILTWIDGRTLIELRSNLPEAEVFKVADGLVIIQEAGEVTEGFSQSSDLATYSEEDLRSQYCNPEDFVSLDQPLLGDAPDQEKIGGFYMNFDREGEALNSYIMGDLETIRRMLFALQDPNQSIRQLPYPAIGLPVTSEEGCIIPDPSVHGYIVVEVWENQVNLGYGGAGLEMKDRAIDDLSLHIQVNEEIAGNNNYCRPNDGPPNVGGLLLGEVSGQKNLGSVRIDFHDRDFFPETVAGGSNVLNIHEGVYLPALEALQDPDLEMQHLPYKSINIFQGTNQGCQTAPEDLQGYIVVEVWENQINIGYGGEGNMYIQRAIKAIEEELEDSKK